MNAVNANAQRPAQLLNLASEVQPPNARARNFVVQWLTSGRQTSAASPHELMLLLPQCGARVVSHRVDTEQIGTKRADIERVGTQQVGTQQVDTAQPAQLPARSVAILPAGRYTIELLGDGVAALIASTRSDLADADIVNTAAYAPPDPRIAPILPGFRRVGGDTATSKIVVIDIDAVVAPAGKSRLKMFQTETLSINWVEYDGPRDPTQLSPHSHTDFEQGSLSLAGTYVHHLRTPWGNDATQWEEDRHLEAGVGTMLVVPVNLIHTTAGIGPGKHLLIDIFSPPRRDFIKNGWVHNAGDYRDEA